MLATIPAQQRQPSAASGTHAHASHTSNAPVPAAGGEESLCAGCKLSVHNESGGMVVAFGKSLWHVTCFRCAKCGNLQDGDTNLLLLSDGSPICAKCYICKVCNLPILDEAVMTGEESYHASCFVCRTCRNRIDENMFAKTSNAFYCMKCHNERVARSRRQHARQKEKEREKERERQALGSSSGRSTGSANTRDVGPSGSTTSSMQGHSPTRPSFNTQRSGQSTPRTSSSDYAHASSGLANGLANTMSSTSSSAAATAHTAHPELNANMSSVDSVPFPGRRPSVPTIHEPRTSSPAPSTRSQAPSANTLTPSKADMASAESSSLVQEGANGQASGSSSVTPPTIDVAPPPYSITPPANHRSSDPTAGIEMNGSRPASPASLAPSLPNPYGSSPTTPLSRQPGMRLPEPPHERERHDTLPLPGGRASPDVQWPVGFDPNRRRKSYDDGVRPASSLLQAHANGSSNNATLSVESKTLSAREKRRSINPAFQLDPLKLQQYRENESHSTSPVASSSSVTPTGPSQVNLRTHSPPLSSGSGGRDSPRLRSPLRDYFTGLEDHSDASSSQGVERRDSLPIMYPSASGSPRTDGRSSGPSLYDVSSSDQGSASSLATPATPATPSHAQEILSKTPQRVDSLNSPLPVQRLQKSADESSGRLSPRLNGDYPRSPKPAGYRRSRSTSGDRSMNGRAPDVPRGIESGTDTEGDADGDNGSDEPANSVEGSDVDAPSPPPKDVAIDVAATDEPEDIDVGLPALDRTHQQEYSSESSPSPMSSPAQGQATFVVVPALPPIRFSTHDTDFSEFFKNMDKVDSPALLETILEGTTGIPLKKTGTDFSPEQSSLKPTAKGKEVDLKATSANGITVAGGSSTSPSHSKDGSSPSTVKPLLRSSSKKVTRQVPAALDIADINSNPSHTSTVSPTSPERSEPIKVTRRKSHSLSHLDVQEYPADTGLAKTSLDDSADKAREKGKQRSGKKEGNSVDANVTVVLSPSGNTARPTLGRQDTADLVLKRLKEAVADATDRGSDYIKLDKGFVEAILLSLEQKKDQLLDVSGKLDGLKRTSQQYIDGLSVAQEEYDRELASKRDMEAEVMRLRIELSGQTAKLMAMSSDERRHELKEKLSKELSDSVSGLEEDLSKLKVQRDMVLAEVEELSVTKKSGSKMTAGPEQTANATRSLSMRFDSIKTQYQNDLVPLTHQRESLLREIKELKESRDSFLEETAVLNARNEELAQLNTELMRRIEAVPDPELAKQLPPGPRARGPSIDTLKRQAPSLATPSTSTTSSATLYDDVSSDGHGRSQKLDRPDVWESPAAPRTRIGLRWPGKQAQKETIKDPLPSPPIVNEKKMRTDHSFQQQSVLRFARCDHCGDKMWGAQLRCSGCNIAVHVRCVNLVQSSCSHDNPRKDDSNHQVAEPIPSMFGRDLAEQVRADSKDAERLVPMIVEKCIDAVETLGMDYEGIYRKTGGAGQSKMITQLFERGDYDAFDLRDSECFNDISSVTSVLKNYFRSLPDPLLTYDLHEQFVAAANIREATRKAATLGELISQLPREHYHTLCCLMLHLNRVQMESDRNLMTARNLGVVFGPTLMRSRDPSREFADMAGKALSVEWLVENAPKVFSTHASLR